MTENLTFSDDDEGEAPGPSQQFVSQADVSSLWDGSLFGPTEDEKLWGKATEGARSLLTRLFNERWTYAYVFRDGETDHFFYKSLSGPFLSLVTPEAAWENIIDGCGLPKDRPMEKFRLIRRTV